ncbi:M24 family metallopeptidase [Parasedimentitalea marina]|uniref:M24 family metallopeptidase n=1 Tax=Parasedimentitalea marina TaxID=2483033 RepID=A0A3T0N4I9_9RHOB|nr:M24 family metallopeptidase [Parasedimentitalea marina]AZV78889.1 M24 family metallopeptidase [Parasedimentitalea marina]
MPATDFSSAEYAARLRKTRAGMALQGIETLIVADPSNMAWLTGYDGWSFYVPQVVILHSSGSPLWWGRTQDKSGAAQTTWLQDSDLYDWPEEHIQHPDHHPYAALVDLLRQRGWTSGLGVEMDNYYYSAASHRVLEQAFGRDEIADATGLVNWQRAVKSEAELAMMRKAGQLTAQMHAVLRDGFRPGVAKNQLVADVQAAGIAGLPGLAGDYPAIAPIAPSGLEASAAHITWNDRQLALGEATYFEVSGCYHRYHCPASRSLYLGEPPADIRRAETAVLTAIEDTLATARPGVTCEDVAACVYESFAKAGYVKANRTGYPVGLSYPPDWGERTMSLRPGDTTRLQAGMTFHLMPGLWTADWGLAITETFVVTPEGGKALADIPRELVVKST